MGWRGVGRVCIEARKTEQKKKEKSKYTSRWHCWLRLLPRQPCLTSSRAVHMSYLSRDREVAYQRAGTAEDGGEGTGGKGWKGSMARAGSGAGCSKEVGGRRWEVGGGRAVLWLLTASISERGRLAHIDSKLVSSRRGVRALDVAGGSQLGETGEQQCLCCVCWCRRRLFPRMRFGAP